ncbi:MAG: hypothetical protein L0170_15080 [Acidobacteria bacterium]|nr:hypothetical protein [Acidobacteriota bacterium]
MKLSAVAWSLVAAVSLSSMALAEEPATASYRTKWIDGVLYKIGSSPTSQVWITQHLEDKDPFLFVYLANTGTEEATFHPSEISVLGSLDGDAKPVTCYSADQWTHRVGVRARWRTGLIAATAPNTPSTTTSGFAADYVETNPMGGRTTGHVEGAVVSEVSPGDKAIAEALTAERTQYFVDRVRDQYASRTNNLLRDHTLDPGSDYSGRVFLKKTDLDRLEVAIPLAGAVYRFEFTKSPAKRTGPPKEDLSGVPVP